MDVIFVISKKFSNTAGLITITTLFTKDIVMMNYTNTKRLDRPRQTEVYNYWEPEYWEQIFLAYNL